MTAGRAYDDADPFDLPSWLGEREVTWSADRGLGTGARVPGRLTTPGVDPVACDLLAVDEAYPEPIAADSVRVRSHRAWQHGQVLVLSEDGRLLLAVPGSRLDADLTVTAVGRLARAVGAAPGTYGVRLQAD